MDGWMDGLVSLVEAQVSFLELLELGIKPLVKKLQDPLSHRRAPPPSQILGA